MWDPTVIDLLAHQVLNCVCTALDDTALLIEGQPGCPCRACVVAGTPLLSICDPGCTEENRQGQLYVCRRLDIESKGLLGSLRRNSLAELWNGPKRMAWLREHLAGRRDRVPACASCEFWGVSNAG